MKTVKQVLIDSRARIEQGWGQEKYRREDDGPKYCAIGAIIHDGDCLILDDASYELRSRAERCIADALPGEDNSYNDVIVYNDSPDTTKEDILKLYDAAIAACTD